MYCFSESVVFFRPAVDKLTALEISSINNKDKDISI